MDTIFTEVDIESMRSRGVEPATALNQIEMFKEDVSFMKLVRPATLEHGIIRIPSDRKEELEQKHDRASHEGRIMKFVPASGAASRMFRDLLKILGDPSGDASVSALKKSSDEATKSVLDFAGSLHKFAFFEDLKESMAKDGLDIERDLSTGELKHILTYLLTEKGLDYAEKPKALLKFHKYNHISRTALEEHLVEAAHYVVDGGRKSRVHFTLSPHHKAQVEELCASALPRYEKHLGVRFEVDFSLQSPSTDTPAVDLDNTPFRDDDGSLLFRPGGHGALLKNLDECGGDIVFIKNIDNVVPDHFKKTANSYRKLLGGYLLKIQEKLFEYLNMLSHGNTDSASLELITRFAVQELNFSLKKEFAAASPKDRIRILITYMNRPLRVCGMVKNEGEPGGGPFWVTDQKGHETLQIVESAQVDFSDDNQTRIWNSSTHFNPVDLVCGIRDFQGRTFNLNRFVDHKAVFISRKSFQGRPLKALELPGLWNGGMAHWNTVFVEVPIETFNPVKVVNDLLRKEHQPA